mgnify:FL=1
MAKGKKSKGNNYQSKGQRPNISRWSKLAQRREHKANPSIESIMQREAKIKQIISSPKNAEERAVKEKLILKQRQENLTSDLLKAYGEAGLTKAEAMQAVKTDYVPQLKVKWVDKLTAWKQANSKKGSSGVRIVSK